MLSSQETDAYSLLRAKLIGPDGVTSTNAVLPFFTEYLDVKFLLIVLRGGDLVVTRDLPQRVSRRVLTYSFDLRLDRRLVDVPPRDIAPLFHFDPWWLLRDRDDIPQAVRQAAIGTNVAGRQIAGGEIRTVYFDESLATVVAARISGGPRNRDRVARDELPALLARTTF
ncbi:MAG: hypothetical protein ACYTGZ_19330 [Planctomycetota bacterium]|jgi:hypothetical protein